jgi:hypothetical protein
MEERVTLPESAGRLKPALFFNAYFSASAAVIAHARDCRTRLVNCLRGDALARRMKTRKRRRTIPVRIDWIP